MKTILLIDGSNFLFRAYHALPPLTTTDGRPTGAIRGFLAMLKTLRKEVPTEYVACVFDAKGKTFRNDIYEEYKANRPPMPEDLRVQIQTLFEIIHASGIPLLQVPGIEADDAIGTIAQEASNQGFKVVIATGDKDYAQLVNSQINLINTMADKNNWLDEAGVLDKYGVHPNQIIDFLSLVGDKVDKVISSGTASIDEMRERLGMPELGTEFSKAHWMTKNYTLAEDMLKGEETG